MQELLTPTTTTPPTSEHDVTGRPPLEDIQIVFEPSFMVNPIEFSNDENGELQWRSVGWLTPDEWKDYKQSTTG